MNILITGGSSGIGEAIVRLIAKDGHFVAFTYRTNKKKALEISQDTKAKSLRYNQNSQKSVTRLKETILRSEFDVLINNAGETFKRQSFLNWRISELMEYVTNELHGALAITQTFASTLKERKKGGVIINLLSSTVLGVPPEKQAPYVILKSALWGASRIMAKELSRYGIRVNCVSPGMTRTPFISHLPKRFVQTYEESLSLQRLAEPTEVAAVIRFLISPEASYLNGTNIPVTGGDVL